MWSPAQHHNGVGISGNTSSLDGAGEAQRSKQVEQDRTVARVASWTFGGIGVEHGWGESSEIHRGNPPTTKVREGTVEVSEMRRDLRATPAIDETLGVNANNFRHTPPRVGERFSGMQNL